MQFADPFTGPEGDAAYWNQRESQEDDHFQKHRRGRLIGRQLMVIGRSPGAELVCHLDQAASAEQEAPGENGGFDEPVAQGRPLMDQGRVADYAQGNGRAKNGCTAQAEPDPIQLPRDSFLRHHVV